MGKTTHGKKVLIIDEAGFSRICSSILESDGFGTETLEDDVNIASRLNGNEFGLVITSYPYGSLLIKEIEKRKIPTIILSNQINKELINLLECFDKSYCMIKPLDYQKFRSIVNKVMNGDVDIQKGYNIF